MAGWHWCLALRFSAVGHWTPDSDAPAAEKNRNLQWLGISPRLVTWLDSSGVMSASPYRDSGIGKVSVVSLKCLTCEVGPGAAPRDFGSQRTLVALGQPPRVQKLFRKWKFMFELVIDFQ